MDYILAGLQTIVSSTIVGVVVFWINKKNGKRIDQNEEDIKCAKQTALEVKDTSEKKQAALENGIRSVIRTNIIQSYEKAMDREFIPLYERESILSAYHDYKVLGGNGMVDHLLEEMAELGSLPPVKIKKTRKNEPQTTI